MIKLHRWMEGSSTTRKIRPITKPYETQSEIGTTTFRDQKPYIYLLNRQDLEKMVLRVAQGGIENDFKKYG